MELWDAYDENFRRVEGVSLVRGEPIPAGAYHLSAMCWCGTRTGAIF